MQDLPTGSMEGKRSQIVEACERNIIFNLSQEILKKLQCKEVSRAKEQLRP